MTPSYCRVLVNLSRILTSEAALWDKKLELENMFSLSKKFICKLHMYSSIYKNVVEKFDIVSKTNLFPLCGNIFDAFRNFPPPSRWEVEILPQELSQSDFLRWHSWPWLQSVLGKLGPSVFWRQIGPWQIGQRKILLPQIAPQNIFLAANWAQIFIWRQIGLRQIRPWQIGPRKFFGGKLGSRKIGPLESVGAASWAPGKLGQNYIPKSLMHKYNHRKHWYTNTVIQIH